MANRRFRSNQSVQNGQFLRRQIISAAMIEGSVPQCGIESDMVN